MNENYLNIVKHYEDCFEKHGDNHLGVDWPKIEDVDKRYKVMLEVIKNSSEKSTLLDFGCGLSGLYDYLTKNNYKNIEYIGSDISEKFIDASRTKFPQNNYFKLDLIKENLPQKYDYIVANGVFTEKRELTFDEMFEYFKNMITKLFNSAEKGIAFNVMSKQVDWERDDLFHLPLDVLAWFVTKNLTRNFIIRNDYGLYEYSVYIYR
jgi:SAM-dependent methyltransferase